MSLLECLDCGDTISSRARACPHCGRPRAKAHLRIEVVAGLGFAIICIVASSWSSTWKDETARAGVTHTDDAGTVIARSGARLEQSLNASIGYNRTLSVFRVENRDAFAWSHCTVSLNARWLSGYELKVESISPGLTTAALLRSSEFLDAGGKQFDPSSEKVATLDLSCDSPAGRLYYQGTFGTHNPASR